MASMIHLLDATKAARLPVEVVPDFLTNGHDGVLTLDRPKLGYLHHTVARVLQSVYYDPLKRPGWPAEEWRPTVPSPRCNVYAARARTAGCRSGCPHKGRAHLVFTTAGKAHHAGTANLGRIKAARAGQISVRTPDATGLPDDYSSAGFESVGLEVDWTTGEDWPADLLDLVAVFMAIGVRTFGWPGVGCWINHRQATYRKPDMDYRGDIWARAAGIEEDDVTPEDIDAIATQTAGKVLDRLGPAVTRVVHIDNMIANNLGRLLGVADQVAAGEVRDDQRAAAVLGAIAALPTDGLTDEQAQAQAVRIATILREQGVPIDTDAVVHALGVALLDEPAA